MWKKEINSSKSTQAPNLDAIINFFLAFPFISADQYADVLSLGMASAKSFIGWEKCFFNNM